MREMSDTFFSNGQENAANEMHHIQLCPLEALRIDFSWLQDGRTLCEVETFQNKTYSFICHVIYYISSPTHYHCYKMHRCFGK